MTREAALLTALLVLTLVLQALVPGRRLLIVLCGAGLSCLASAALGLATTAQLLAEIPWDVLVILVGLGLLAELLVGSRVFGLLALAATRASGGDARRLVPYVAVGMYVVSGLVNNLTALILVLPVLLSLFQLVGVRQRYVSWTLALMLVACNLGGAATPIGDFPAILLLGRGSLGFYDYFRHAAPATAVALGLLLVVVLFVVRPARGLGQTEAAARLSVAVMDALHRHVRLDLKILVPTLGMLVLMIAAWIAAPARWGLTAELVCWLGVGGALAIHSARGERLLRTRVDVEAALFLLALFVMVAAVRRTGLFGEVARAITELPLPPVLQLVTFLLLSGLLTGLFSAGPGMAALLEVADVLATRLPAHAVYVGLALAVCAGSSLFLTAATSGPLAQGLTERARLRDPDGAPLRFGFFEFLPAGLLAFAVLEAVALAYAVLAVRFA